MGVSRTKTPKYVLGFELKTTNLQVNLIFH